MRPLDQYPVGFTDDIRTTHSDIHTFNLMSIAAYVNHAGHLLPENEQISDQARSS